MKKRDAHWIVDVWVPLSPSQFGKSSPGTVAGRIQVTQVWGSHKNSEVQG